MLVTRLSPVGVSWNCDENGSESWENGPWRDSPERMPRCESCNILRCPLNPFVTLAALLVVYSCRGCGRGWDGRGKSSDRLLSLRSTVTGGDCGLAGHCGKLYTLNLVAASVGLTSRFFEALRSLNRCHGDRTITRQIVPAPQYRKWSQSTSPTGSCRKPWMEQENGDAIGSGVRPKQICALHRSILCN